MKSYIISLPTRSDRFDKTYPLLTERGFDVERFNAIRLPIGWQGCRESHLEVLRSIKEYPTAVFEDDLEFINPIEVMHKAIEQAGEFDMLYLGCDPQQPMVKVGENLLELRRIFQTHAIVYGSQRVVDYILSKRNEIRKIDVFFAEQVIPKFKCYGTLPMVCKQSDGHSDIQNTHLTFDYVEAKYNSMVQLTGHGDIEGWNEELRYDYDLSEKDIVLDIGSYTGEFSKRISQKGCKVIPFDTDTQCAWIYDGEINIGRTDEQASFLYEGENYPCVDILHYLKEEIALCKINIEGGEYPLLEHILDSGLQSNVKNFQIQFHKVVDLDYENRYKEIAERLSKTHKLSWRHPFIWESWERL